MADRNITTMAIRRRRIGGFVQCSAMPCSAYVTDPPAREELPVVSSPVPGAKHETALRESMCAGLEKGARELELCPDTEQRNGVDDTIPAHKGGDPDGPGGSSPDTAETLGPLRRMWNSARIGSVGFSKGEVPEFW
jgi:hypothetical protein